MLSYKQNLTKEEKNNIEQIQNRLEHERQRRKIKRKEAQPSLSLNGMITDDFEKLKDLHDKSNTSKRFAANQAARAAHEENKAKMNKVQNRMCMTLDDEIPNTPGQTNISNQINHLETKMQIKGNKHQDTFIMHKNQAKNEKNELGILSQPKSVNITSIETSKKTHQQYLDHLQNDQLQKQQNQNSISQNTKINTSKLPELVIDKRKESAINSMQNFNGTSVKQNRAHFNKTQQLSKRRDIQEEFQRINEHFLTQQEELAQLTLNFENANESQPELKPEHQHEQELKEEPNANYDITKNDLNKFNEFDMKDQESRDDIEEESNEESAESEVINKPNPRDSHLTRRDSQMTYNEENIQYNKEGIFKRQDLKDLALIEENAKLINMSTLSNDEINNVLGLNKIKQMKKDFVTNKDDQSGLFLGLEPFCTFRSNFTKEKAVKLQRYNHSSIQNQALFYNIYTHTHPIHSDSSQNSYYNNRNNDTGIPYNFINSYKKAVETEEMEVGNILTISNEEQIVLSDMSNNDSKTFWNTIGKLQNQTNQAIEEFNLTKMFKLTSPQKLIINQKQDKDLNDSMILLSELFVKLNKFKLMLSNNSPNKLETKTLKSNNVTEREFNKILDQSINEYSNQTIEKNYMFGFQEIIDGILKLQNQDSCYNRNVDNLIQANQILNISNFLKKAQNSEKIALLLSYYFKNSSLFSKNQQHWGSNPTQGKINMLNYTKTEFN